MAFKFNFVRNSILPEVIEITPDSFQDLRGSMWTSFADEILDNKLIDNRICFKHDKFSHTKRGALRGLHGDEKSWKLVSCPFGKVFQVTVDARVESSNYLKATTTILSGDNKKMILIPPMFANGFCATESDCLFHYKLAYEGEYNDFLNQFTIKWNDPRLGLDWPINNPILSARDA